MSDTVNLSLTCHHINNIRLRKVDALQRDQFILLQDLAQIKNKIVDAHNLMTRVASGELSNIDVLVQLDTIRAQRKDMIEKQILPLELQLSVLRSKLVKLKNDRVSPVQFSIIGVMSDIKLYNLSHIQHQWKLVESAWTEVPGEWPDIDCVWTKIPRVKEHLVSLRDFTAAVIYMGCPWLICILQHKIKSQIAELVAALEHPLENHESISSAVVIKSLLEFCGFQKLISLTAGCLVKPFVFMQQVVSEQETRHSSNNAYKVDEPDFLLPSLFSATEACYSILSCSTNLPKTFLRCLPTNIITHIGKLIDAALLQGYSVTGSTMSSCGIITSEPYMTVVLLSLRSKWFQYPQSERVEVFQSLLPAYQKHLWAPTCRQRLVESLFKVDMKNQDHLDALTHATSFKRFVSWWHSVIDANLKHKTPPCWKVMVKIPDASGTQRACAAATLSIHEIHHNLQVARALQVKREEEAKNLKKSKTLECVKNN